MATDPIPSLAAPAPTPWSCHCGLPYLAGLLVATIGYVLHIEIAYAIIFGLLSALCLTGFLRARNFRHGYAAQAALLATNEETFRRALNNAEHGLALISRDGKWLEANPAVSRITGYDADELLKLDFQTITHPDDLDADLHFVEQILAHKIETYSMEKRYIRKDGQIIWVLLTVSAAWDPSGKFRYFISEIRDINERKLLQEKLRASEAKLRAK